MAHTGSGSSPAAAPGKTLIELVIAVAGALLGTWIVGALDQSPEMRLLGAVLGALVPPMLSELLPKTRTRPLVAVGVAVGAILLTYTTLTAADFVTKSSPTFPLPRGLPSPAGTSTESRGGLAIEVSPTSLECNTSGCAEPVTVQNLGDRPLKIYDIEVDGNDPGNFIPDPEQKCANRTLRPNEYCSFEVTYSPPAEGKAKAARLVINQNLPGDPTFVSLSGEGGPADGPGRPQILGLSATKPNCSSTGKRSVTFTYEVVDATAYELVVDGQQTVAKGALSKNPTSLSLAFPCDGTKHTYSMTVSGDEGWRSMPREVVVPS
jgi:hypothetical protein